jgi:hypothetical protein
MMTGRTQGHGKLFEANIPTNMLPLALYLLPCKALSVTTAFPAPPLRRPSPITPQLTSLLLDMGPAEPAC